MRAYGLLAAILVAGTVNCAVTADEGATPEEIRSNAWQQLVAPWTDTDTSGDFHAIVFESTPDHTGHHFFAEAQGVLISCHVGTGCTHTRARTDGYFTATATHITLHVDGQPNEVFAYTLATSGLTMSRAGTDAVFTQAASYCDTADDCSAEGLIHPDCAPGGFVCGTDNTCAFHCGGTGRTVGQTCGGIADLMCDPGLVCVMPPGASHPDEAGTCTPVANEGEHCGGNIANAPVCADGLHCVLAVHNPDLGGTCQR